MKLLPGAEGFTDASTAVDALEIPADPSRAQGDVHPGGNPHYSQDPVRAGRVAALLARRLGEVDPKHAAAFGANLAAFNETLGKRLEAWTKRLAPFKGAKVVTYHRDLVYFADRFGLVTFGEIEPKPGIPPTAQHTAELVRRMKEAGVKLVLTVPWYEDRTPKSIAEMAGARVAAFALLPGGAPGTDSYFSWMDYDVETVAKALEAR